MVNATEAHTVRFIFERYAALGSVTLLRQDLDQRAIVSKRRSGANGLCSGGQALSRGALYLMLQNRLYRGEVVHKGKVYPGQHEAIVDAELWQTVQDKLAVNRRERTIGTGVENPSLLAGLITDADGHRLTPTHANKRGKRYRYYVSAALLQGSRTSGRSWRVPAGEVEAVVLSRLHELLASRMEVTATLAALPLSAGDVVTALAAAADIAARWTSMPPADRGALVRKVLRSVTIADDQIRLQIAPVELAGVLGVGALDAEAVASIPLTIAARLARCGKGKRIVVHNGVRTAINPALVTLLQHAFAARETLLADTNESLNAIEARLGTSKGRMTALMRLSYLSPEIVRDILVGRQPTNLGAKRLIGLSKDLPHDWLAQRAYLGFERG